jgi:hypothetical protein
VHTNASFDYAVVRVVPRVDREEFVNAGVILFSSERSYLACRIHLDTTRLRTLAPDLDVAAIEGHLTAFVHVCAGNPAAGVLMRMSLRERFHWLTAPRSTMVQVSSVRTGVCPPRANTVDRDFNDDLKTLLDGIVAQMIDVTPPGHNSMMASCTGGTPPMRNNRA